MIVVAIIAVLVAVAIPVFGSQLEKAGSSRPCKCTRCLCEGAD
ncbi:MAG: type IV pilin protein [Ruminococcus sp.]